MNHFRAIPVVHPADDRIFDQLQLGFGAAIRIRPKGQAVFLQGNGGMNGDTLRHIPAEGRTVFQRLHGCVFGLKSGVAC